MLIDDDLYDAGPDIGYCTRCGNRLDTEPATSQQCWDCVDQEE